VFVVLVSGLVAQPARRTVTGMLIASGASRLWHHSRAHRFLGVARWCVEEIGKTLVGLIVTRILPADADVVVIVDDSLFRRSGRRVYGTGWHHDGAAKGPAKNRVSWGNCWVIAGIRVDLPFIDRPVCLPVAFALWRKPSQKARRAQLAVLESKQVLACRLVEFIAEACPGRQVHMVADAWYAGADGEPGAARSVVARHRGLPPAVTLTSRLRVNAALHAIAVPVPGKRGRPKRIDAKIGTPKDLANRSDTTWTAANVHRYGRDATVHIADTICLWYGVYRSRAVRVILLRDTDTTTGYDLALITTDLTTPAAAIVERYADRWSIEVAIEDAKQLTGVGEARNRTPTAVERTVPFGLIAQSLVIIWYALHGHHANVVAERRDEAHWYQQKTQPSYQDMITTLRRTLIAARFRGGRPHQPTPTEILAVQHAWAEAAA
jgi:hypothetical protein